MAANRKIVDLRNLLAERFASAPASSTGTLITGIDVLDENGGLPKGGITELISARPSAGSALFIHCLLRLAQRDRFFLALVDGRDSFDVQSAGSAALAHLLWVRCETATQAMKAADFLLRDGNFPLVILDLILNTAEDLRRIPATSWYRLQRLVEAGICKMTMRSRKCGSVFAVPILPSLRKAARDDECFTLLIKCLPPFCCRIFISKPLRATSRPCASNRWRCSTTPLPKPSSCN
jgi:hypothetical protein